MGDITTPFFNLHLINSSNSKRFSDPEISLEIVSKVKLANVESMISIFEKESAGMVKALRNYQLVPDLF